MTIIFIQIILIIILLKVFKNHKTKTKDKPANLDDSDAKDFGKLLTFEELLEDEENNKK